MGVLPLFEFLVQSHSARWHLQTIVCFGGKNFDYVPPAHQEQAASNCELDISIQDAVRDETREE